MTGHTSQYSVIMAGKKRNRAQTLEQDLLLANSSSSIAGTKMISAKSWFLLRFKKRIIKRDA